MARAFGQDIREGGENVEQGNDFARQEVASIYVDDRMGRSRFIVSLVVGFAASPEVLSAEDAAIAALDLTRDAGAGSTTWFVYDRLTCTMRRFQQEDLPSRWHDEECAVLP